MNINITLELYVKCFLKWETDVFLLVLQLRIMNTEFGLWDNDHPRRVNRKLDAEAVQFYFRELRLFYFVLQIMSNCQICSEQASWMILFFLPSFLLKISKMQPTLEEANTIWFIFYINIESPIRLYFIFHESKKDLNYLNILGFKSHWNNIRQLAQLLKCWVSKYDGNISKLIILLQP